jgi:DNA uptake protein ComE-like DNA-binding protein
MKFLRRFNSSDRDAAIVLALVIIVSIVLFPHLSEQNYGGTRSLKNSRAQEFKKSEGTKDSILNVQFSINLRPFDPNTATESQLLSLGLSQREVRNILKYRARGGRYRVKEDFARVYGLTLEKYRQLEPYIAIKPQIMAADVIKREKNNPPPSSLSPQPSSLNPHLSSLNPHLSSLNPQPSAVGLRASRKLRYGETVDINSADTAMLKRIPGIGDYYAMRIVELRKRKQVFSSPEELLAIRNFPETALTYMTASQDFPAIYINCWSQKQLASHPLLNYTQARDIISLRRLSGPITSATDLAALPSFSPALIEKITPLLRF